MNRFFVLRAAPATGKSTWIAFNGFEDITVCPDELRIKILGFEYDEDGKPHISQEKQNVIWGKVREDIAARMERGEDIILDACARTTRDMKGWRELIEENGYDAYVVEFYHDVDAQTCKERNLGREDFRQVPDYVIDKFFDTVYDNPVPDFYTVIDPVEAASILLYSES